MQDAGYKLQVTGCKLPVAGYWLPVAGYWLQVNIKVASCESPVTCDSQLAINDFD